MPNCETHVEKENTMLSQQNIMNEIEAIVTKYGPGRYGMWFIETAYSKEVLKHDRRFENLHLWEAESDQIALEIKNYFVRKGMATDFAGIVSGKYVYLF